MRKPLVCLAVLLAIASRSSADFTLGPGPVSVGAGDEAFNLIAVDLNNPAAIGPGKWTAGTLNYQFTDFAGFQTKGNITPLLLTGSGTNFTPIAVGSTISYSGATSFISTTFGGTDTFNLAANTTVYAGLFWETTYNGGPELRMPVGYAGGGNSFVVYGGGTGVGASPPVIGTPISGTGQGFFSREYNFSIEVKQAIPEPSSLLLLALAGGTILGYRLRRKLTSRQ